MADLHSTNFTLRLKRGVFANVNTANHKAVSVEGEIAYTTDTEQLFVFNDTEYVTPPVIVRSVTDAGPMTATNGKVGEIVFNTSDTKFYGCTVTGTPGTWAAFH